MMMNKRLLTLVMGLMILFATAVKAEIREVPTEQNGRLSQVAWTDDAGNPVPGPNGYATVKYSYKKDSTTEEYFDEKGLPYETAGGYYGRKVTLDGKKRVIQVEFLDMNGERTLNSQGYALVSTVYYGFGEVRTVTYYGLNKKPVTVPSLGYASVHMEYSNRTLTARTYRNAKGKPVDSTEGYATVKQKLNKSYQVIRIRYEHADGSPATGPDGWYRCIKDRDEKGRIISVKYYDEHEELTDRGAGYAWEEREYPDDNIEKVTYYDLEGKKVAGEAGVVTLVREMKDGLVVKESYLDGEGKRINNALGVGATVYAYDHQNRIEKVTYLSTEGVPMNCKKGYAGYREQRDEEGVTTGRIYLGTDGQPTEIAGGYAEERYVFDETKQITGIRYYNANGSQVQTD